MIKVELWKIFLAMALLYGGDEDSEVETKSTKKSLVRYVRCDSTNNAFEKLK